MSIELRDLTEPAALAASVLLFIVGLICVRTGIEVLRASDYDVRQAQRRRKEDNQFVRWMNGQE